MGDTRRLLTEPEKAHRGALYERQDKEETALFARAVPQTVTELQSLQNEVDLALARLVTFSQRVQAQAEENEALRRDIAALYQRLAPTSPFS